MKNLPAQIRLLSLGMLLAISSVLSACSTGTKDGDTNVEKGKYKDINPDKHNAKGESQPSTDTTANMAQPYEEAERSVDRDVDRQADSAGSRTGQ